LYLVRLGWSHGDDPAGIRVEATAKVEAKTGVEMAALTAVSVACLCFHRFSLTLAAGCQQDM
jgi:molybdenum cofactor biosynthesis enzyme